MIASSRSWFASSRCYLPYSDDCHQDNAKLKLDSKSASDRKVVVSTGIDQANQARPRILAFSFHCLVAAAVLSYLVIDTYPISGQLRSSCRHDGNDHNTKIGRAHV